MRQLQAAGIAGSRLRGSAAATLDPLNVSGTAGECVFCTCTGESPLGMVDMLDEKKPPGWFECLRGADEDGAGGT